MTTKVFMAVGFWTASSLVLYAFATLLHGALGTPSLRGGVPRFVVDDDRFVRDGRPFVLRSGSLHYARVPRAYWRDRLLRLRALGLNCVTTYVPWNFHEDEEGRFDFSEDRDVYAFADEAHKLNLLLILRIGPYMCGAVWKSNFGRPTPSTRRRPHNCICSMAWRFTRVSAIFSG